jgi:2-polyprenyl-6-methoxyphenol hydroxylase-like FAD-dependent oxidoreductase
MTRGRVYWFATNNVPKGQRDPEGRTKDMLLQLFRGWHKPIQALITSAEEGSIVRSDIYELNPLPRFVRGLVGLLGDAAHAMTPNLGQGDARRLKMPLCWRPV